MSDKRQTIVDQEGIEINMPVWAYTDSLSRPLNKLKAQLYSLAEASGQSREQSEAHKKLIKGFCNDTFRDLIQEMNWYLLAQGVLKKGEPEMSSAHLLAEPLEVAEKRDI